MGNGQPPGGAAFKGNLSGSNTALIKKKPRLLPWLAIIKIVRIYVQIMNYIIIIWFTSRKGYVIKEILGSKMYLDRTDPGISSHLYIDGIREAISVGVVKRMLKEGDVTVEVGANIGYYALLESRLIGGSGKVYAIEPSKDNIELLRRNIELNGRTNIDTYECAIGDTNGYAPIYLMKQRNLNTLRDVAGTEKEAYLARKTEVRVMTLDEFIRDKRYPSLVRMDVEGYEYQVIKGMKNILAQKLPLILFIEFHFHLLKKEETVEIFEILRQSGFHIAVAASESPFLGQHRYKLLSRLMRFVEPEIARAKGRRPLNQELNLTFDDILSNPSIMSGQWGTLHLFFARD